VRTKFSDDAAGREKYLLTIAADSIAATVYEYTYRVIYGSQLAAVRDLNSSGTVDKDKLKSYFDTAKSLYPAMYETDNFERWLQWLIKAAYLVEERDGDSVQISEMGRDFLQFVITRGYAFNKTG